MLLALVGRGQDCFRPEADSVFYVPSVDYMIIYLPRDLNAGFCYWYVECTYGNLCDTDVWLHTQTASARYNGSHTTVRLSTIPSTYNDLPILFMRITGRNQSLPGASIDFSDTSCCRLKHLADATCGDINILDGHYLELLETTPHSIAVGWRDGRCPGGYHLSVTRTRDNRLIRTATVPQGVGQWVVDGLDEATQYTFTINAHCGDGTLADTHTVTYTTSLDDCIDYINLTDSTRVHLTRGTFSNPFNESDLFGRYNVDPTNSSLTDPNAVIHRYLSTSNRHSVYTDPNEMDPRTGNRLHCVPSGEKASLRLGNEQTGRQAETITYDIAVDSNQFDLLLLRYALVMQQPGHPVAQQPHFTMEILDDQERLLDSTCSYVDFAATANADGWNQQGSSLVWKDWTTVGIDVAPFHGQTIKVRFTNKDCDQGAHYGYAYLILHCDQKRLCLLNKSCGLDSITLRAPSYFDYRWSVGTNPDSIISTRQEVTVPVDSTTLYRCRCSFVGKPECYYEMETYAPSVVPRAQLDYWIDTCRQTINVINKAFIEIDSSYDVCLGQDIMATYWKLDDGTTVQDDTLRLQVSANRMYTIWLMVPLSESNCVDSVRLRVPVSFFYPRAILGDTILCQGDATRLTAVIEAPDTVTYSWNTGSDSASVYIPAGSSDSLYWLAYDDGHCRDTLPVHLHFHPYHDDTIHVVACEGYQFDSLGFHESSTGRYTFHAISHMGCDSLFTLDLLIHPTYTDTLRVATCDTPWGGHAETGLYTDSLLSIHGCDSLVHLDLLRKRASIWGDTVACEGQTVTFHATDFTDEGAQYFWQAGHYTPSVTLRAEARRTPYLLDIVVNDTCTYHLEHPLVVHPLFDDTLVVNICHGYYDSLDFYETETGRYTHRLLSRYGCDSLFTLDLTHRPNYYDTLYMETCDQTYVDPEWTQDSTGFYTHAYQTDTYLCDSILNLDLIRWPVFTDTLVEEIYSGDYYIGHGFHEGEEGFYELIYTDRHRCDSLYRLDLTVISFQFPNLVTPDGDGYNDRFVIHDLFRSTTFDHNHLWIYDRTGRLIFERQDMRSEDDCWDPNQTHSPTGTYFFRFQARSLSKSFDRTGVIEVVR